MTAPDTPFFGFRFLLLALILSVNAFFAAAEVALLSVRESRLRQLAEEGEARARVALNLLANPEKLLSVTQVGVTLASLGLGWAGEDTLYQFILRMFQPLITAHLAAFLHALSFVIAFLVMTYCHVIIGEVVPKNLAIEKADRLAIAVAPALMVFSRLTQSFIFVIERSASAITRIMGIKGRHRGGGHSVEELKLVVSSSAHLPETQEDIIHRVIDMGELSVREIMVSRNEVVSVALQASLDEVLRTMIEHQHSRLPVFEERPEHIVGILYFKDLLPVWQERRNAIRSGRAPRLFRVARLMRPFLAVPETKSLVKMLDEFRQGKSHMAMVVDEFGTIVGLLTVEDVLEQIVGEIQDEFDETPASTPSEAAEVFLDAATKIRDFESLYGIEVPTDAGFETLAGFILFRLGHIPKSGESVEHEGRRFTVLDTERNRITRLKMEKVG